MPDGENPPSLELAPGFKAPMPTSYESMQNYIETALPAESPIVYGMHPNAELSLLTSQVSPLQTFLLQLTTVLADLSSPTELVMSSAARNLQ